jgi:hypothetical protein
MDFMVQLEGQGQGVRASGGRMQACYAGYSLKKFSLINGHVGYSMQIGNTACPSTVLRGLLLSFP